MSTSSKLAKYKSSLILIGGVILGAILGLILGENAKYLEPLGTLFINLLFCLVVPLVFLSISSSVASVGDIKRTGKIVGTSLIVFFVTSCIAAAVALVVTKVTPFTNGLSIPTAESGELGEIDLLN